MARKNKGTRKKLFLSVGAAVLVLAVGLFALEKFDVTNFVSGKNVSSTNDPKTTSTAPTAQDDFTDGGPRDVNPGDDNEGTVQDTGGNVPTIPPESQWSKSSDQRITVYGPAKNSVIKKGDTLSGVSTLTKVNFRLIDDVTGVIVTGSLAVEGGKFSGSFDFSTSGTNGRLDVFTANADGVESSVVEIPVRFK